MLRLRVAPNGVEGCVHDEVVTLCCHHHHTVRGCVGVVVKLFSGDINVQHGCGCFLGSVGFVFRVTFEDGKGQFCMLVSMCPFWLGVGLFSSFN